MLEDHEMTNDDTDLKQTILGLYEGWRNALATRRYDWFERHLTEDYTMTAHPFANIYLNKQKFIEVDKLITEFDMNILDLFVHRMGNIVVSNVVIQMVKETFASHPGANFPTAEKLGELLTGKKLVYSSAWRNENGIWKCFDHHLVCPLT